MVRMVSTGIGGWSWPVSLLSGVKEFMSQTTGPRWNTTGSSSGISSVKIQNPKIFEISRNHLKTKKQIWIKTNKKIKQNKLSDIT